jgi:hypothetical protein
MMTLEFKNRLLVQRFEQEAPPLPVAEAILPTRVGALKHTSLEEVKAEYLALRHTIQADLLRVLRALPRDVHGKFRRP